MRTNLSAAAIAAAALSFAGHALAHDGERSQWYYDRVGPEAWINAGVWGFVENSTTAFTNQPRAQNTAYTPGFGLEGGLGTRFTPWLAVGGSIRWGIAPHQDLPMGTTGGTINIVSTATYVRLYIGSAFHLTHWEPWLSVGFSPFSQLYAQHDTPLGSVLTRFSLIAIPIQGGLDYNLNRWFSAGLMINVSPWIPYDRCDSTAPNGPSLCSNRDLVTNTFLYAGAQARIQLPW